MISQNDNSVPVIARAVNLLKEMPYPYPAFAELLRFFACLDYSRPEEELHSIVKNYLIAILKKRSALNSVFYTKKRPGRF